MAQAMGTMCNQRQPLQGRKSRRRSYAPEGPARNSCRPPTAHAVGYSLSPCGLPGALHSRSCLSHLLVDREFALIVRLGLLGQFEGIHQLEEANSGAGLRLTGGAVDHRARYGGHGGQATEEENAARLHEKGERPLEDSALTRAQRAKDNSPWRKPWGPCATRGSPFRGGRAGGDLTPLKGLHGIPAVRPRLTPWATLFRPAGFPERCTHDHALATFIGLPHSPQNLSSFSNLAPQDGQTEPLAFGAAGLGGAGAAGGAKPFSAIRAFSRSTSASTPASSFCRSF